MINTFVFSPTKNTTANENTHQACHTWFRLKRYTIIQSAEYQHFFCFTLQSQKQIWSLRRGTSRQGLPCHLFSTYRLTMCGVTLVQSWRLLFFGAEWVHYCTVYYLRSNIHCYTLLCRGQLKCDGTRAETRFSLSAKRTSPLKSAGASV
jgi:hypothetical protein